MQRKLGTGTRVVDKVKASRQCEMLAPEILATTTVKANLNLLLTLTVFVASWKRVNKGYL